MIPSSMTANLRGMPLSAFAAVAIALLPQACVCTAACSGGQTIPNSNRDVANPCHGILGAVCEFTCDAGYYPIGKHVCQHYEAGGTMFVNHSFFGGRCVAFAKDEPTKCSRPGEVPLRLNDSAHGVRTRCFDSSDALLKFLARGNYEVWRRARNNRTGLYLDNVDLTQKMQTKWALGASGTTGLGLIVETIADALGWEERSVIQTRVLLTLRSLNDLTPGCHIPRDPRGFFVHYFNSDTCVSTAPSSCLMCSGLLVSGALFTRNYFVSNDHGSQATQEINELVDRLWKSVQFEKLLCDADVVSSNGTEIPMVQYMEGAKCGGGQRPQRDGFYGFNEEHYTVWLAYEKACSQQERGTCDNKAIENMWNAWQGRRLQPNQKYGNYTLLSMWSGYIVHLPFYTSHAFNSDPAYQDLFRNHWLADWDFYNQTAYAGERGRYGLGAGPTAKWCTEGLGYQADRITSSPKYPSHCRNLSPYIIAGYLPAARDVIMPQLLDLLSDAETVIPVTGTEYVVLWRSSMLDPSWVDAARDITLVDFSSELLGLSTIWLGVDFFYKHTNHFRHDSSIADIII